MAHEDELLPLQEVDEVGDLVLHVCDRVRAVRCVRRVVGAAPAAEVDGQAEEADLGDDLVEDAGGAAVVVEEDEEGPVLGRVLRAREGFPEEEGFRGGVVERFALVHAVVHGA